MRRRPIAISALVAALAFGGCSDDDPADTTTTAPADTLGTTTVPTGTTPAVTSTSDPATSDTTSDTTSETLPTETTPTEATVPREPGEPCAPGTPECVEDAWGDGVARYLEGYDDCIAALDEGLCSDLDQDGYAGYPDSG